MLLEVSPSIIVWKWFQDMSWPTAMIAGIPDKNVNEIISLSDIDGAKDGQLMRGEIIYHPGIQFRSRSRNKNVAYSNLAKTINKMANVNRPIIVYGDDTFRLDSFKLNSAPVFIGQEEQSLRYNYTSDGTVTVVQLT